jgi:hypothetical protein
MPTPKLASPARARKAKAEAHKLLLALLELNLAPAAQYIRDNPPSADAIAMLAFYGHDVLTLARQRAIAKVPRKKRPNSLPQRLRDAGLKNASYAEVCAKAPDIKRDFEKASIMRALSRLKKE